MLTESDLGSQHTDVVWRIADVFRSALRRSDRWSASIGLAEAAAVHWSERTGRPLPDLLTDRPYTSAVPMQALSIQEQWLGSLHQGDVASYLPTVARVLGVPTGEHSSTTSLIRVAVSALLARSTVPTEVTLFDPAAGSGGLLVAAAMALRRKGARPLILGQEINVESARFAAAAVFLSEFNGEIRAVNSLTVDAHPATHVEFAVSIPPLGLSWATRADEIEARHRADDWYPFGLPPRSDGSWLFASRMIEKLRPAADGGGRVVTFIGPRTATSRNGDDVRRALIESDLVETVIALPSGVHEATDIPLFAIVLTNRKQRSLEGRIQAVDLRAYYETDRTKRWTPRALSEAAHETLERSLGSIRSGIVSRTVPNGHFLRQSLRVSSAKFPGEANLRTYAAPDRWIVSAPGDALPDDYLRQRYGCASVAAEAVTARGQTSTLSVDTLFDSVGSLSQRLERQGWGFTRLSMLLVAPPAIDSGEVTVDPDTVVMLPTGRGEASVLTSYTPSSGRVLALAVDTSVVSASFLAGWLNSPSGQESCERALRVASTGVAFSAVRSDPPSLWRLVDELIVPVPTLESQEAIAATHSRLDVVASMLNEFRRALWDTSTSPDQVRARFEPLLDESFAAWSNTLPYPVASALRTLEASRGNVHAAHKQVFRVWEAYTAFWGTALLSALDSDPVAREGLVESIRSTLSEQGLSMARATIGSWRVIVERLSKHFRGLLDGNSLEEQARVVQVFGGPSSSTLRRLLSPDVVRLINEANVRRNAWDGHSGALSQPQLEMQLAQMDDLLRELRSEISSAWSELQLVRAGTGARRGGQITQSVELLTGPVAPFMQAQFRVGELMDSDQLYLATSGAAQPLHMQPLVVLRSGPDSVRTTCYFYNRLEGEQVRLVSYQLADDGEVNEPSGEVGTAAAALIG
jgi:type I restriction enzyme M protein